MKTPWQEYSGVACSYLSAPAPMHSYVTNVLVYNLHITIFTRVYSYVTRVYSYVLVCYSCVTRMLLVCTRMLLVCTRMYSYVTRMYSGVTRMLLVCSFSHDRFGVQFEINKHEKIFSKTTKIARARRASAICSLWKNLQVLIYSKLHEKNHVTTY